jgi:hypothetical protein
MGVFWFEPMRLALRSTQLACRQCQLMAAWAWLQPWTYPGPTENGGRDA